MPSLTSWTCSCFGPDSEVGVVESGVEVLQAALGVVTLPDIALRAQNDRGVGGERLAIGAVVMARGRFSPS